MILSGSRYENVPFTGLKFADGRTKKLLHDRRIFGPADIGDNSFEHTIEGDEQLDVLADRFYDDDTLWWIIADVNDILFFYDVKPGDRLVIPDPAIVTELRLG